MSLLKHIEENVEHLYALIKHVAATQESAHGGVVQETKDLLEKIEEHLGVAKPAEPVVATVAAVVEPTIVVEAPQTVAQEQSASNVAN